MDYLIDGIKGAFFLIFSGDIEVYRIVFLSLRVSVTASVFAAIFGFPLAFALALKNFRGREAVMTVLNTLMAMPTVVIGLLLYSFISRRGPLGFMELLFTPSAIIIGDVILAFPIVTALTVAAVGTVDQRVRVTAMTLGAGRLQTMVAMFLEARSSMMAAFINGFGRVIAEVGCAMMVGGNIRGYTRTMTTAIALETSKGEFAFALALGFLLLSVALGINIFLRYLQKERQ
jgi:tungstate transport system permease protein